MTKKPKKEPSDASQDTRDPRERGALLFKMLMDFNRTRSERKDPVRELARKWELSATQIDVIRWLGFDGPLLTGVLSERAQIHDKSITGVVDRLEERGLVQRRRPPEDRRSVIVALTDEGRKVYSELEEITVRGLGLFLVHLSKDEEAVAFKIMERLQQSVDSLPL